MKSNNCLKAFKVRLTKIIDKIPVQEALSLLEKYENIINNKVLIVDDQMFNIKLVHNMLKINYKFDMNQIDFALNGEEAVQLVEQDLQKNEKCSYKLILMDCQMPVMDGYTATRKIKDLTSQPRIVAVSGHADR